ncbi:MAG: tetratricopeptide repeat protein [Myxococcota bacterium]
MERIRALVAANPADAFGWYSLAMEERKVSSDAALATFQKILKEHPSYLPAYYQHGKLLIERGAPAEAQVILQAGISLAQRVGDGHALGELSALLEEAGG